MLIDFGAIARQGAFPDRDAVRTTSTGRTQVRSSSTLVHKSTRPSRRIASLNALLLGKPFADIVCNLIISESANLMARELTVIKPGLVVPDKSGSGCDRSERVFRTEPLHPGRHFRAAGSIEKFIQTIKDYSRTTGNEQPANGTRGRRTLIEGF